MFMIEYRNLSWWYWLVTVGFLTAGLAGWPTAFLWATGLTIFQIGHYVIRERSVTAFAIQVRVGYLLVLLVAWPPKLQLIYWLPMIGTWVRVLFGYCTMARTVSLLPWNRREPLSFDLLRRTFLSAPIRGGIMQG